MVQKFSAVMMLGAVACLSGCYDTPPTTWSTVVATGYYGRCPTMVACVVSTRGGMASVASYNGSTTVTSSAGAAHGAVATTGTTTAVAAEAGSARAAVGTTGNKVGISTSAGGNSNASLLADGTISHGTTQAGAATIGY